MFKKKLKRLLGNIICSIAIFNYFMSKRNANKAFNAGGYTGSEGEFIEKHNQGELYISPRNSGGKDYSAMLLLRSMLIADKEKTVGFATQNSHDRFSELFPELNDRIKLIKFRNIEL